MSESKAEDAAPAAATAAAAAPPTMSDSTASGPNLSCRMYEERFPEVDQLVMVNVRSIAEMGAYVCLLEYNEMEGMILLSELSRRRFRSITKLIRVGKNEVVVVMRVDKEKGYIDLSKRRVTPEDVVKLEQKYNKSKAVHSIMRHVAESTGRNLEELYQIVGWPLYKKYGHAYDAFSLAVNDTNICEGIDVPQEIVEALMSNIRRRLTPTAIRVRADIEVTCFTYEGIDAIRTALRAGEAVGTVDAPIKVSLIAPPLFVMTTQSLEKEKGIEALQKAIEAIKASIEKNQGELHVKQAPRAVTERDDRLLTNLMETMERENAEVSGDEDDEGEDE
eukprot:gnl/Hemi2/18580_TR6142_c0_g1_i1.p1 gnl/Hemi2/18580_TR6142_c0_g1~~gnl/Hemi2/18580_TR6142_c0_g1_i1.p1  ORF type:complete len:334 (-),score=110.39 gnl/Hemi2/18580_TR6142_c0_g1_i1:225-1226(-)